MIGDWYVVNGILDDGVSKNYTKIIVFANGADYAKETVKKTFTDPEVVFTPTTVGLLTPDKVYYTSYLYANVVIE